MIKLNVLKGLERCWGENGANVQKSTKPIEMKKTEMKGQVEGFKHVEEVNSNIYILKIKSAGFLLIPKDSQVLVHLQHQLLTLHFRKDKRSILKMDITLLSSLLLKKIEN